MYGITKVFQQLLKVAISFGKGILHLGPSNPHYIPTPTSCIITTHIG